jgi:hypothetical protein
MDRSARDAAAALIEGGGSGHACVINTLLRFGAAALQFARRHDIRIVALNAGDSYGRRSAALARLGVDVDSWPAPPAGLFVVEERCVYLRSRSTMTVAHEFAHGLDCALGGGIYRSGTDTRVREFYAKAQRYVTPYAATSLDEYFAESLRAYVEANDPASFWPRATRERLRLIDPDMFAYVEEIFSTAFAPA